MAPARVPDRPPARGQARSPATAPRARATRCSTTAASGPTCSSSRSTAIPYKQGQYLPGTHIPIRHPDALEQARPDYILILPWNLKDEIVAQLVIRTRAGARSSSSRFRRWRCCEGRDLLRRTGLRMREASEVAPKPMIPVGPRPVLWHVMKYYAHFGFTDFVLCLGYKAEAIKHFFLTYSEAMANDFVLSDGGRERPRPEDRHPQLEHHLRRHRAAQLDRAAAAGRARAPRRRRAVPRELRRHAHRCATSRP